MAGVFFSLLSEKEEIKRSARGSKPPPPKKGWCEETSMFRTTNGETMRTSYRATTLPFPAH